MTREKTWFDRLFDEFNGRGEAMFAFSKEQVEQQGVTWEDFQAQWTSVGAGLHVKTSAFAEFVRRMETDQQNHLESVPELRVKHIGSDFWDRTVYEVVDEAVEGKGVRHGQRLCDVSLSPPNEATELHTMTSEGEPIDSLEVRPVYVLADGTERKAKA